VSRVAGAVDTTSTTGDAPVTVRVSCTAPMPIGTLTVATKPVVSLIPSRRTDWNPDNSYTTLKTPIGNGVSRYSPRSLVTVVTEGTCSEGLVAVTVTPGRAAPLSSVTTPTMLASCCAAEGAATPVISSTSAPRCLIHCDTRRPRGSRVFICTSVFAAGSPYDPAPGRGVFSVTTRVVNYQ
jgi:hypothetical protein